MSQLRDLVLANAHANSCSKGDNTDPWVHCELAYLGDSLCEQATLEPDGQGYLSFLKVFL